MGRSDQGLRETLKLVGGFTHGQRRALAVIATSATLGGFAEAAVLVVIARLAFALATHTTTINVSAGPIGSWTLSVPTVLGIAFGLVLMRVALQIVQSRVTANTVARVLRNLRVRLTRLFLGASWRLQSGERTGRLQEMVGGFATNGAAGVMQVATAIVALASLVTFLITALAVSALAAGVVALTAGALALVLRPLRNAMRDSAGRLAAANLTVATDVTETSDHALEVRVFGVEQAVGDRIEQVVTSAEGFDSRTRFLGQVGPAVYQGVALMLMVGVVAVLYAANVSRLGAVGGVVLIMIRSLTYGQALLSSYQNFHTIAPMLETLRDEIDRFEKAAVSRGGDPVAEIGELSFDHVDFEYVDETPVLRDVTFRIPHGEVVGLVGPSGAGKSTLVQLVLRLREPTRGCVRADGRDVRGLSLDGWYDRVGFVPQDPALFAGSVADNIRFFREGIDQADVERAAKLANLHDEVMGWARGYDTPVGERGRQLSGGQRQRLCIARALVDEPDILVFDEPTSSLDVKSEALIRETMLGLAPRTTVIVIAHRISTLSICDRIMVLLNGVLQGFDKPAILEAENHFYREALELSGMR